MSATVATARQATLGKRLAPLCLTPAHASLPAGVDDQLQEHPLAFECIEATQRKFKKSDKEMATLLGISQPNYSRRKYNAARRERLELAMRQFCVQQEAQAVGLHAEPPTDVQKLVTAARHAMSTFFDLMEALR